MSGFKTKDKILLYCIWCSCM